MTSNFERSLRKAKKKNLIRMIVITMITLVVAIPLLYWLSNQVVKHQSDDLNEFLMLHNTVKEPNIQIDSQVLSYSTATGGEIVSNRSKNISGYIVPWSTIRAKYSLTNSQVDTNDLLPGEHGSDANEYSYDRQTKQKIADFYHPNVAYEGIKKLPNDLEKVDEDKKEVAEIALSFEKPQSLKKVEEEMPEGVTISWLYVLSPIKDREISTSSAQENFGFEYTPDNKEDNYKYFIESLEKWNDTEDKEITSFIETYKHEQVKKVPILGVLVTGENKDLKKLVKTDGLRASSIGVTVPINDYIKVEK